jgi:hypothetical protein
LGVPQLRSRLREHVVERLLLAEHGLGRVAREAAARRFAGARRLQRFVLPVRFLALVELGHLGVARREQLVEGVHLLELVRHAGLEHFVQDRGPERRVARPRGERARHLAHGPPHLEGERPGAPERLPLASKRARLVRVVSPPPHLPWQPRRRRARLRRWRTPSPPRRTS